MNVTNGGRKFVTDMQFVAILFSFLQNKFFYKVKTGAETKGDRAAFYAVFPIVAVGLPGFGGDDVSGVGSRDAREAEDAFAAFRAGAEGRNDGVGEF